MSQAQGQTQVPDDEGAHDSRLDRLENRLDDLEEQNHRLRRENADLRDDVADLEETVDELHRRNQGLRGQLDTLRERDRELREEIEDVDENATKAREVAKDLAAQVNDLRQQLEQGELSDHVGVDSERIETETPLEDIVSLPENIAREELHANQYRTRLLASDITRYATPSGSDTYVLSSTEASRIIREETDSAGQHQTVARVFEWFERLDEDHVDVTTRSGSKTLSIATEAAERLDKIGDLETHTVVRREPK